MRIESNSSINTALECPKKYQFKYIHKVESPVYPHAAAYGTFVHYFKECEHKGVDPDRTAIFREYIDKYPEYEDDIQWDIWLAEKVSYQHKRFWDNVDGTIGSPSNDVLEFKDVEGEWGFNIDHEHKQVGKRDGYVYHKDIEKFFLYELKTSGTTNREAYKHKLENDSQIDVNILAIQEDKQPVSGVFYDIIWKPAIRIKTGRKKLPDETRDEFYNRIVDTYASEPRKYFERLPVLRTQAALIHGYTDLSQKFKLMDAMSEHGYPRNTGACLNFNKLCTFFDVCTQPDSPDLLKQYNRRHKKLPEITEEGQQ